MTLRPQIIAGVLWLLAALPGFAQRAGGKLWSFPTEGLVQSSPALAPDGTIFCGSDDGFLYALAPDGKKKWSFKAGGGIAASPLIGPDGTIYFGSLDRTFYAVKSDGTVKWSVELGGQIVASAAMSRNGTLYVGTVLNTLFALTPDGGRKWELELGGNLVSSPVIGADDTIYIGCRDNSLYAISPEGKKRWNVPCGDSINASPVIDADGTIYFGSIDGRLHAVTPEGSSKWEYATGGPVRSSPAIAPDGTIYIGSDDRKLHAVNPDGTPRWAFATGYWVRSSPAIATDGTIYFGSYDNNFYALQANGVKKWDFSTAWYIVSSPVIAPDGTVYFGSWDKEIYALKGEFRLANSPWPMFRGEAAHTARADAVRVPPVVQLVSPTPGEAFVAPATILLHATASVPDAALAKAEFFQGTNLITEITQPPFQYQWTDVPPAFYRLTVRITTKAGARTTSSPVPISVQGAPTADKIKPTIAITSHPAKARVVTSEIILAGNAKDNSGIARVEYQIGNEPFRLAEGTKAWSAPLNLQPGDTTVTVRAVDLAGNVSTTEKVQFNYTAVGTLNLETKGEGRVTPNLAGQALPVGRAITLNAEPARDWLFAGWSGDATGTNPKLTIAMRDRLTLQALFVPKVFARFKGDFNGLIEPPAGSSGEVGFFSVSTSDDGDYKGRLQLGGASHALTGRLDEHGEAQQIIVRVGKDPLRIALKFQDDTVEGTVIDGPVTLGLLGDRQMFDGKNRKAQLAGRYTVTFGAKGGAKYAPTGDGIGVVTVDARGALEFNGTLADGTPVSEEAVISKDGLWPVFMALADGGVVHGWIRFKPQDAGDLFGQLTWVRAPSADGKTPGFTATLNVLGSAYTPVDSAKAPLTARQPMLVFKGADLPGQLALNPGSTEKNPARTEPRPESFRFNAATGLFRGTFTHPVTGKSSTFEGVILQKGDMGTGYFLTPNGAGQVYFGVVQRE